MSELGWPKTIISILRTGTFENNPWKKGTSIKSPHPRGEGFKVRQNTLGCSLLGISTSAAFGLALVGTNLG